MSTAENPVGQFLPASFLILDGLPWPGPNRARYPFSSHTSQCRLVPTLVKDKAGKPVFGLQVKDFIIEDDGVEQQISMDEAEPQEAVSLVIAIQSGRSAMYEFQRMKGINAMLDQIASQPQVQTAIVVFDDKVELAQNFSFESGADRRISQEPMEGPRRNMEEGNRSGQRSMMQSSIP
jgi:hypothetical protein